MESQIQIDFHALSLDIEASHPLLFQRIATSIDVETNQTLRYFIELLRFMALIGHSQERLTPSYKIDLVWHEFILFTRLYMKVCETYFGRYIHHAPGRKEDENQQQFKNTVELYEAHFGKIPLNIWGISDISAESSCGPCES